MFKRGNKPRHITIAVFIEAMNPAQSIQHDKPCATTELNDSRKVPIIHDVQTFTHDRLNGQVLCDGLTCLLTQVFTNGMNTPHQRGLWVLSSEIDHPASLRRSKSY